MRDRRLLVALLVAAPAVVGIVISGKPLLSRYLRERPYHAIDLPTLDNFQLNEQTGTEADIPEPIRKLDGKQVSVDGMMWDLHSYGPAALQFQLVYNLQHRRWSPPLVQERVFVHGNRGSSFKWFDQLVRVRGTLHVHLRRDDTGMIRKVFVITDPTVDIAPPQLAEPKPSHAWILGILVSAAPVLVSLRRRLQQSWEEACQRRMRRNGGFCRRCGYDLRASTVRCPECGTPFTAPWRFKADSPLSERATPR